MRTLAWFAATLVAGVALVYAFEHLGVARSLELRPWRIWGAAAAGLVLLSPVALYSLRKRSTYFLYLHFRRMADFDARVAAVRSGVMDLQREVYNRVHTRHRPIRRLARGVLRAHGLGRYFRVVVEAKPTGEPGGGTVPEVRLVKRDPMGPLSLWLKMHVWLGLLAFVVIVLHTGLEVHGVLAGAALVLFALVTLTGLGGALLFRLLPPRLTPLEGELLPDEMRRKGEMLDARMAEVWHEAPQEVREAAGGRLAVLSTREASRRSEALWSLRGEVEAAARALGVMLVQRARLDARYRLERRHEVLLHGWLAVHVPLAAAMAVAVAAHAISFWYY
ncbi:MAG: hypothetical protein HY722_11910 [Planctomycetes bacterium]|nr:hypothetical protein [Planctomycetota bacterium]